MKPQATTLLQSISTALDFAVFLGAAVSLGWWWTGEGLFYTSDGPVLSPFTSFSLLLMSGARLAPNHLERWPLPLTLAWLGIVIGGNVSSVMLQLSVPGLLLNSFPSIVPTSIVTSIGLILFCSYQMLINIRQTPESTFIVDDILLHLALLPGCVSLLGHWLDKTQYISDSTDPRIGISLFEMAFMGTFAIAAAFSNPHLFLWRFLAEKWFNKYIFAALFTNQFVAPLLVAFWLRLISIDQEGLGVELFIMLAGVIATLSFLCLNAYLYRRKSQLQTAVS